MAVKQASVTEAHALQQQGHTYVDVRSTPEFERGHPAGAVHVPLLDVDEDSGQMAPNPDFVRVISANFAPDTPLLLGCQMGGRSQRAAQILESFGYSNVTNVRGGFGGARDPMTGRAEPGWRDAGLPVETKTAAGASYRDLAAKADADK
jgi:rhodanese-related sulfurtransferase